MTCPHCGEAAKFEGYRPKTFTGLLGDIRFDRAYYHCPHCKNGHFPADHTLRIAEQRQTPGAREAIALAGAQDSFGKVAERLLYKLTGLRLCESTVERTTEAAGKRLGELLETGTILAPATPPSSPIAILGNGADAASNAPSAPASAPWNWHRDATGTRCAYVSIDATGIMMQGPNGAKADGRMVYLAMVYNPRPRTSDDTTPCADVRYLAGLTTLDKLGDQLRRQAAQVGMNDVEQWIALSDAGSGFEPFFDVYFPRAAQIVDFWHAVEHLTPLSQLLHPGAEGEALLTSWCHSLKHEGGPAVLATLEALDRTAMTEAARVAHDEALTYFRNHSHKMNYPEYLRRGWQIGSGSVESGCKNVINKRLSMGGMRWGEAGGDSVAHLRALFCSEERQWDAVWAMAA
jgi:hypothetical protein